MPGTYTVVLQLTDSQGNIQTGTTHVIVDNEPPSVDAGPDQAINEGQTASFNAVITDPGGPQDITSVQWDFNYDNATFTPDPSASGPSASHPFLTPGTYTVAVQATDASGDANLSTLTVTVNPLPPTATVTNSGTAPEGSAVTFTVAPAADPDPTDTITYWADWTGSGEFEEITADQLTTNADGSVNFSHVYDDASGPGGYSAVIRVMNSAGQSTDYPQNVVITDVAPTGTFGPTQGGPIIPDGTPIEFTNVTCPSPTDTDAGFTYFYSTDGSTYTSSTSPEFFLPDYSPGLSYTVSGYIQAQDGATSPVYTTKVTVAADLSIENLGTGTVQVSETGGSGPVTVGAGQTYDFGQTIGNGGLNVTLMTAGANYDIRTNGSFDLVKAAKGVKDVQLILRTDLDDDLPAWVGDGHVGQVDLPAGKGKSESTLSVYARGDLGSIQGPGGKNPDAAAIDLFFANLTGSVTGLRHIHDLDAFFALGDNPSEQISIIDGVDNLVVGQSIGATVFTDTKNDPKDPGTIVTVGPGGVTGALHLGPGPNLVQGQDQGGNITSITDPVGNKTTFTYDSNNNPVTMTDPLGNVLTRTFDQSGNLLAQINRDGLREEYTYNSNNQVLTATWYAADGSIIDQFLYTYDSNGNLLSAGNNQGTYTFTYNASNQKLTQTDPNGVTLTYGYDANGNVTSVADSLGGLTTSSFDSNNNLLSRVFTAPGQQTLRVDFTYDPSGNVLTETRYSDAAGTQKIGFVQTTYNSNNQPTQIQYQDDAGKVIDNFLYTYDSLNRVTSETHNGVRMAYKYDSFNQLIAAGKQSWTYDANGNRTNPGYVTGPANELLSDGTWNYRYDPEGNLIGKTNIATGETWTYGFNNANQLITANQSTSGGTLEQQITYAYDVFGNRISQSVFTASTGQTVVTKFAYNGSEVWGDLSASDSLQTRYLRGDGIDQLFGEANAAGAVQGYVTDNLGSVRGLTNGTGALTAQFNYDPWGNLTSGSAAALGRYGWIGREFDSATGFYHGITGRNYNPQTGRWNSQDSALFQAQDANLYRYASNSPTNSTDPSGQGPWWQPQIFSKIADSAANLAKSTANYVAEKAQQIFTTIQVAGQTIKAKFEQTLNAAGQAIQYVVDQTGKSLVIIGGQVVAAGQAAARAIADQVTKFGQSITKLWDLAQKFGANASKVIQAIVNNPGTFAQNLAAGVGQGFKTFFSNFSTYLPNSLFSWLTKGLSLANIVLPKTFDLAGTSSFLLQLMGLTLQRR